MWLFTAHTILSPAGASLLPIASKIDTHDNDGVISIPEGYLNYWRRYSYFYNLYKILEGQTHHVFSKKVDRYEPVLSTVISTGCQNSVVGIDFTTIDVDSMYIISFTLSTNPEWCYYPTTAVLISLINARLQPQLDHCTIQYYTIVQAYKNHDTFQLMLTMICDHS